jgi:membrane fusion protein (multidrug efflux system)
VIWVLGAVLAIAVLAFGARSIGLLGGGAGADAAGAQADAAQQQMPPMPVDVDTARQSNVVDYVRATGRVEAVQAIQLRPDATGRILRLMFTEGQRVAAGTPLVQIDDALLRAQAERARAESDLAKQQLARVLRLRADNAASPADVERAEAAARTAEASLNVLALEIERTTVLAPFSGVVGQRFVSTGDYVTPATPLVALQTVDPQRISIEVPERYSGQLSRGQEIEFVVAAQPERTFTANVDFVDPVVQEEGRTIVVKATAPNRDGALKAGMFVEARLATQTREGAVVIPEDAVQPLRTANVVWAVVDGVATRRVVQLGARTQGFVEILSGVEPGEIVVIGGLERMAEGMPVAPR